MFNNFLDSLDITNNSSHVNNSNANNSGQLNTGYQQRTKSGTSNHGSKVQA